jgi:hypothetical protein
MAPRETTTERPRFIPAIVVLGLMGAGAVAGWIGWQRNTRTSGEITELRTELGSLQDKLREHRQPSPPEAAPVPIPTAAAEAPATATAEEQLPAQAPPAPAASATTGRSIQEQEAHRDALNAAQLETLEEAHAAEVPDPQWAAQARQQLQTEYAAEDFHDMHVQVDCRSTMCRVDFDYPDDGTPGENARKLTHIHPWSGRGFTRINLQTRQGHLYLAREGTDLPRVDPSQVID